ncbi:uncharacterized protein [Ambystoma mexicanum]|uniref:uncharacterized protein n=1 Tax=Ambystoma mexicanum TaxID=8296 RepID=UPI0037E9522D
MKKTEPLKLVEEKLQKSQDSEVGLEHYIKQLKEYLALQQQNNSDQEDQLNALRMECQQKVDSLEESQLNLKHQVRYNNARAEQMFTLQNQIKKLEEESNTLIMKELIEKCQKLGAIIQQRDDRAEQRGALYQEKEDLYQEICNLKTNLERRESDLQELTGIKEECEK